jgi:hypothetical protein
MLYSLLEGLAGIEDRSKLFQRVALSPRWLAAGISEAEVQACYNASQASIGYTFRSEDRRCLLEIAADLSHAEFHVLIPEHMEAKQVKANGKNIAFKNTQIENSRYVDFFFIIQTGVTIEIQYAKG